MGKGILVASGHDHEASPVNIIVGAAVVVFGLLVFGVFYRKGWKKKKPRSGHG